jgi:hypothetical protein
MLFLISDLTLSNYNLEKVKGGNLHIIQKYVLIFILFYLIKYSNYTISAELKGTLTVSDLTYLPIVSLFVCLFAGAKVEICIPY